METPPMDLENELVDVTTAHIETSPTDIENEFTDVNTDEQMSETPIQPDEPTDVNTDEQMSETPIQPDEPTDAQKKAARLQARRDERWRNLQIKWDAETVERNRLHDLKPAQERFNIAVQYGQFEKVKAFLESGEVDVNLKQPYYTPMHHAVMHGDVKIVQLILEHGGDVEQVCESGWTALHHAVLSPPRIKTCRCIVRALLLHGSNVNKKGRHGRTPIHCAVLYGSSALVRMLLDNGANVFRTDDAGCNALHHMAHRGHRSVATRNKICRMLLDSVPDVKAKLRLLNTEDEWIIDSDDSDNDVPGFRPSDLAEAMDKPLLANIMNEAELICVQQISELKSAKAAKVEAGHKLARTALAMGLHPRLGDRSLIMALGPDILAMIGKLI
jgi:hypothetical protein